MSDDAAIPSNVGDTPPVDAVEQGSVPAMGIRAQYIKDLSFENPHAPGSLLQPEQPRIDVNVNVEAKPAGDLGYEVTLNIRADARSNERTAFVLELEYAGLFDLTRIPEAQRHAVCLIEAPRLLFPFARQIAAETTRSGGFPPMYLDPIDFGALYRNHLSQQQGATQVADSATTPQAADARASES